MDPTGGRVNSQMFCSICHMLRFKALEPSDQAQTVLLVAYDAALADRMVQLRRP